jgi:hypothetical protein
MKSNDNAWAVITLLSIVISLYGLYLGWKMNQRWNRVYDSVSDQRSHPVIEQFGGTVRFDINK